MADGVVIFKGANTSLAHATCKESVRQAALRGGEARVACYAAGTPRPHTEFERRQEQANQNNFTLMLSVIGALIASLVAAILVTHARHNASLAKLTITDAEVEVVPTHPWLEKFALASVDVLILLATYLALSWPAADDINLWSRLDRATAISHGLIIVLTIAWFWLLLEHYTRRRPFWDELREIFHVLAIMFMVSSAAAFVAGLETGRTSHLTVWALTFLFLPFGRFGSKKLLDDFGLWKLPAIIIGTGENALSALLAIHGESSIGYRVIGLIDITNEGKAERENIIAGGRSFPVFTSSSSIETLLDKLGNPQIILAPESINDPEVQRSVRRLLATRRNIHIIPSIRGLPLFGTQLSHFFSHEVLFLTIRNNLTRRGYFWIKRLFDVVAASALLILLSPIFLAISGVIRRDGGVAIYSHTRVGRHGRPFKCLKFRTMRPDADKILAEWLQNNSDAKAEWTKNFKLKNDPRITPVGHFLRRSSLDELPQLINVIRGEMSLVGPRPIVTEELERYGDCVSLYLQVLPGITGLWQVSGRSDTGYGERVSLDTWYVQNWSLWYDVAILFKTIAVVFARRGAY
jgi:Undecaprenyl-phosphate galactose phosphotransferase WbaP